MNVSERRKAFWRVVRLLLREWSIIELTDGGWDWVIIQYRGVEYKFDFIYQQVTRVGSGQMKVSRLEAALLYAIAQKVIRYNQRMFRAMQRRRQERQGQKSAKPATDSRQMDLF